jgi:hypothetical protein
MLRYSEAVEPGTVWTWNAIGKADGAWQLAPGADEARKGFLLNHLISEELPFQKTPGRPKSSGSPLGGRPAQSGGLGGETDSGSISNSDPITGQAGWYDVRVRIRPADPDDAAQSFPQVAAVPAAPGLRGAAVSVLTYFAGRRK